MPDASLPSGLRSLVSAGVGSQSSLTDPSTETNAPLVSVGTASICVWQLTTGGSASLLPPTVAMHVDVSTPFETVRLTFHGPDPVAVAEVLADVGAEIVRPG